MPSKDWLNNKNNLLQLGEYTINGYKLLTLDRLVAGQWKEIKHLAFILRLWAPEDERPTGLNRVQVTWTLRGVLANAHTFFGVEEQGCELIIL